MNEFSRKYPPTDDPMCTAPYLRIARHFNIPYGVVLAFADAVRRERLTPAGERPAFDVWERRAMNDYTMGYDSIRMIRSRMTAWVRNPPSLG